MLNKKLCNIDKLLVPDGNDNIDEIDKFLEPVNQAHYHCQNRPSIT